MKLNTYRVAQPFGSYNPGKICAFADNVGAKFYNIEEFLNPPVTQSALAASSAGVMAAQANMGTGGKAATAERDSCLFTLRQDLQKLALFVEGIASDDLPLLLSSGFETVSKNRASGPLLKPSILQIISGFSGQALLTVSAQKLAKSYEVMVAEVDENGVIGEFRSAVSRTSSRRLPVDGLTPGRMYAYRVRAVGGTTYLSDWSDTLMQRAM